MRIFIGLDGGGTGCRAQAELEDGRRTPVTTGGAANVFSNPDGALHEISAALARAHADAQAMLPQGAVLAPHIVLGLAGASESGAAQRLQHALPYRRVHVLGDIDISLKGAFANDDGIVLAVGTGSVLACQRGGACSGWADTGLCWAMKAAAHGSGAKRCALRCMPMTGSGRMARWSGTSGTGLARCRTSLGLQALPARPTMRPLRRWCWTMTAPIVRWRGTSLTGGAHTCCARSVIYRAARKKRRWPRPGLGPVLLDRIIAQGGANLHRVAPKGTALDGAIWQARHSAAHKETHS